VFIDQDMPWEWRILLYLDAGPYTGLWFHLLFTFPERYPDNAPQLRFIGPPYHVNISEHGRIYPEITYEREDRFMGIIPKIRGLLATKPVDPQPVDDKHGTVFQNQWEYDRRIQEARRKHGMARPEEFTRDWTITRRPVRAAQGGNN
jgi:ubiquitin-protein ligase